MTSSYTHNPVYSIFTLGMLEATGWYAVNYSMAQNLTWGSNKGCQFLNSNCINTTYQAIFPEFCSNINVYGCTQDGTNKALCNAYNGSPLTIWDYFSNSTVSYDSYSDNCPYFYAVNQGDCRVPTNANMSIILYDESYGTNSRCFAGTFTKSQYSQYYDSTNQRGGCFQMQVIIMIKIFFIFFFRLEQAVACLY